MGGAWGAWGAWGGVRRAHCGALAALAALLLLLARLAPAPPPAARPLPLHHAHTHAHTTGTGAGTAELFQAVALHANSTAAPVAAAAVSGAVAGSVGSVGSVGTAGGAGSVGSVGSVGNVGSVGSVSSVGNVGSSGNVGGGAAVSSSTVAAKRDPRVVLTRDVYVAGHEQPHPELCPSLGARLRLLVLVTSAPSHAAARDAVRLTWGHYAARSDVALGFVLGAPPASLRSSLAAEDALYGDLIVGRSIDSYSNLTLKTLSMLEWVDTYCPRAPRLLKTDDDMFINVPRLLRFAAARANATRTIWGKVVRKSLPKRTTKSKYYVSPLQFPGKVFPDFATGPAYLVTADAVRPLLRAAPSERYLRLEDVFVTGVLAQRLGLRRTHAPEFYNKKVAAHPCAIQRGIAVHMVRYHEQFDLWRKLLDGKTKCAS